MQLMVAAALAVLGTSCSPARSHSVPPVPAIVHSADFTAQFDTIWTRFNTVYPSFEYKGVDWNAQRALYRDRARAARSQDEFIGVVRAMLEPLRDLHVWFIDPRGQTVPTYRPMHVANFDSQRWRRALSTAGYVNRSANVGSATVGGYGYLFIPTWEGSADVQALDVALAREKDAPGLIIDVRTNGGGNDATALGFAARFTPQAFSASYVQVRNGPFVTDLGEPVVRTVSPRGAWQYLRPVVVIAGRAGFSATESFVAAMRTLPNVTVIGDTTGGASGNPAIFPMGNGWSFTVPQWIEYGPDGQPIEGRGVAPHIAMSWIPAYYDRERDPLIDAAVGVLAERNGVYRMAPAIGGEGSSHEPLGGAGDNGRNLPRAVPPAGIFHALPPSTLIHAPPPDSLP